MPTDSSWALGHSTETEQLGNAGAGTELARELHGGRERPTRPGQGDCREAEPRTLPGGGGSGDT